MHKGFHPILCLRICCEPEPGAFLSFILFTAHCTIFPLAGRPLGPHESCTSEILLPQPKLLMTVTDSPASCNARLLRCAIVFRGSHLKESPETRLPGSSNSDPLLIRFHYLDFLDKLSFIISCASSSLQYDVLLPV